MKLLNNIIFFVLAAIILILGYFIGSIILIVIFSVIALMTIFFILSWLLNNMINITNNYKIKLFIKYLFTSITTIILLSIFWTLLNSKILTLNYFYEIIIIWAFCTIIQGSFWALIKTNNKTSGYNKSLDMYVINNNKNNYFQNNKINYLDVLLTVITATIITFIFYNLYLII